MHSRVCGAHGVEGAPHTSPSETGAAPELDEVAVGALGAGWPLGAAPAWPVGAVVGAALTGRLMVSWTTLRISGKLGSPVSNRPSGSSGSGRLGSNETLSSGCSFVLPASVISAGSTSCGTLVDTLPLVASETAWKFFSTSTGVFWSIRYCSRQRCRLIRT